MLRVQEVPVSELKPWEGNPRVNDHAVEAVTRSIRAFGFNVPILCDEERTIVAGHTRWKAAVALGLATVPVITLRLTESQRKAFSVADNKTAEIADWDCQRLIDTIEQLQNLDIDLAALGYSDSELRALLEPEQEFDWEAFDAERSAPSLSEHVMLLVKVPRCTKEQVQAAIDAYARTHQIADKDTGIETGGVLMSLLGIRR